MPATPSSPPFRRIKFVLILWAALAAVVMVLSAERVGHPFPGFLVTDNLYLGNTDMADWTGPRAGLASLDRIVTMDGAIVGNGNELVARVRQAPAGTPFRYGLADGRTVMVRSMMLTWQEFSRFAVPLWLGAVVHLALGGWVLIRRPLLAAAVGHWRYCQLFAAYLLAATLGEHWAIGNVGQLVGAALMAPALAELVLAFPLRPASHRLERRLRFAAWAGGLAVGALVLVSLSFEALFPLAFTLVVAAPSAMWLVALFVWIFEAVSRRLERRVRGQARMALAGLALSLGPAIAYSAAAQAKMPLPGGEWAFLGLCAFPAAIALAIVRHQAFDIKRALHRAAFYGLLTTGLGAVYLAVAVAGHVLIGRLSPTIEGASVAGFVAALAVAVAMRPAYARLKYLVDRWFFGERQDPLDAVAAFSAEAERLETDDLALQLVASVRQALGAAWVEFRWRERLLVDGEREAGSLVAAELAVQPQEGPAGTLSVGPRLDETPYDERERALLDVLARQAAMALDRAMLFEARLALELQEATASARAEAREHLLRQVVHDLGTELSNIAVSADLVRQSPGEAGPLDSIQASLARIERFLAEKRYRLQAGDQATTALGPALESAVATLGPHLALRGQRLAWTIAGPEALVPLSSVELAQVLVNLVENAGKFSPERGVIRLSVRVGDRVVIRVEDDGPGIAEDLLPTLGDGRRGHTGVPGHGFGLQNCRALVTAAGGTLTGANGKSGAVFEVSLPALSPAEPT